MKTKMLSACLVLASLSWGSGVQAATVFTTPTSIGGRVVLYPLQLSASGYVNNQSIDATLSNAALNQPVRGNMALPGRLNLFPPGYQLLRRFLMTDLTVVPAPVSGAIKRSVARMVTEATLNWNTCN